MIQRVERTVAMWFYENRWLLLVAFLIATAVHYQVGSNALQNPDSYWIGQVYQADHWTWLPYWETMQGRWGLWAVDAARGSLNIMALTVLPMLLFYIMGGGVLCADLFCIDGYFARLTAVLLIACAPAVAAVETYRYCCASYALSFLLAVAAVGCVAKGQDAPILSMVAGSVCLTFSLSLYQTGLSVTAGLALLLLLHRFLVEERDESLLLLRLLVMGLCGTLVYFLLYKLLLFAGNLQAAGYSGADQFGLVNILKNLSKTLGQAYLDFYSYYIGHDIAANSYGVVGVTATLFIVGGAGIARQLWKRRDKIVVLQAILCIVLLPVAVNVTSVLLPGNTLLLRTAGGFLPIFPFLLAEAQAAWPDGTLHRICGGVALLLAVLIVRCYSVQVSADGMTMLAYKQQYISVMRQIEADVTASPEYQDAECLAVAGRLPSEKYPLNPVLQDKADPFAVSTVFWGMAFSDRVAWINGFYEELGWQPQFCDEARYTEIINSPEFGEMPCYPEQGAIQLLDGVLVVKVSP